MADDLDLVADVGKVLRDIRLLVTEGIGDEAEIMARKADVLARIEAVNAKEWAARCTVCGGPVEVPGFDTKCWPCFEAAKESG